MKPLLRKLLIAAIAGLLAVAAYVPIYLFGHHNIYLSRSYYLEKNIRNLLYVETHEPIDYELAASTYEDLLARIRFDQSQGDHLGRYQKALARTREKQRIVALLDQHHETSEPQFLHDARAIFTSPEYRELEEYHFTLIWYRGTLLSDDWFHSATNTPSANSIPGPPSNPPPSASTNRAP